MFPGDTDIDGGQGVSVVILVYETGNPAGRLFLQSAGPFTLELVITITSLGMIYAKIAENHLSLLNY